MTEWQPIETAPKDKELVAWGSEGLDLVWWSEGEPDGPDSMGNDPGWFGIKFAVPGRSFGNPNYMSAPQGQPTHWLPTEAPRDPTERLP